MQNSEEITWNQIEIRMKIEKKNHIYIYTPI